MRLLTAILMAVLAGCATHEPVSVVVLPPFSTGKVIVERMSDEGWDDNYEQQWVFEISQRFHPANTVALISHGGWNAKTNVWAQLPNYFMHEGTPVPPTQAVDGDKKCPPENVIVAVRRLKKKYPDKNIVVLACNPGGATLMGPDLANVYYAPANIWIQPDSATVVKHTLTPEERETNLKLAKTSRIVKYRETTRGDFWVGSIWEFKEAITVPTEQVAMVKGAIAK
jgi:hypothetical protein